MSFAVISPIRNPQEAADVLVAAEQNGRRPVLPTHAIRKDGVIVGCASVLLMTPLLNGNGPWAVDLTVWLHTERVQARESFYVLQALENIARGFCPNGLLFVRESVMQKSPFLPLMGRMGFDQGPSETVYVKQLR